MAFQSKQVVCGLIGEQIQYSLSPKLHQAFAQQCGINLVYELWECRANEFMPVLRRLQQQGVVGVNVTVPHKQLAYQAADTLTRRAQAALAVNTLVLQNDNKLLGDNTDGMGLSRALREIHAWPVYHQRILVLGAGGAAHGIVPALLALQPQQLQIANRTLTNAQALVAALPSSDTLQACCLHTIPKQQYDLIINTASPAIYNELKHIPPAVIGENTHVYDIVYQQQLTPLLQWAQQYGAKACANGLAMLLAQAAESFYQWFNQQPKILPVWRALATS